MSQEEPKPTEKSKMRVENTYYIWQLWGHWEPLKNQVWKVSEKVSRGNKKAEAVSAVYAFNGTLTSCIQIFNLEYKNMVLRKLKNLIIIQIAFSDHCP